MRGRWGIPGNCLEDSCCHFCCSCCAMAQEARELKARNAYQGVAGQNAAMNQQGMAQPNMPAYN